MKQIYEDTLADMLASLKNTIDNFSEAYNVSPMVSLFNVPNQKFNLLRTVDYFYKYQVRNACCQLCIKLCKQSKIKVLKEVGLDDVDFVLEMDGKIIGYAMSFTSEFMPNLENALKFGIEEFRNIVLEEYRGDKPVFYLPNSGKYKKYPHKKIVKNITIKQFFEIIRINEYEDFKEMVERYNCFAEQMLGMTVSAIPTKKAMEKHKEKIKKELTSYFYEKELYQYFSEEEVNSLKKWFIKNYEILLSDADFSKSFLSSEWYYDLQVKTDGGIEQTSIVAGYLKSLEQIMCSILLTLSDEYIFSFKCNSEGKKQTGKDRLPLSYANIKLVHTMAGNLLNVIKNNKDKVLYKTNMTEKVLTYLERYIDKRNEYMHKDNIYEWTEIENIRIKTYSAYFLVLSTFKIKK